MKKCFSMCNKLLIIFGILIAAAAISGELLAEEAKFNSIICELYIADTTGIVHN